MDWFKKHTDAVMVIGAIIGCMIWMNGEFNELKKDVAIIKTVLIIKNIFPIELAKIEEKNND